VTFTVSRCCGRFLRLAGVLAVSNSVGMDVLGKLLRLSVRAALGLSVGIDIMGTYNEGLEPFQSQKVMDENTNVFHKLPSNHEDKNEWESGDDEESESEDDEASESGDDKSSESD